MSTDRDPNPWWRDDHLNDGLGPTGVASGSSVEDAAPTRAEAAEDYRQMQAEWAAAERRRGLA